MIVTVTERGGISLAPADWAALSGDRYFWKLVSDNIIRVETDGSNRWKLRGTCYVGRARIGGRILQIVEKFPGALEALVRLGALQAPRVERVPSPVTPTPDSTTILVTVFLEAVKKYLSGAKRSRYVHTPDVGAIVGGRLDITRTIALRARGIFHQVAFDRTVLSADVPLNRCVYSALREIERLARVAEIPSTQVARARSLRIGLSECLPSVFNVRRTELAALAAHEVEGKFVRPEARDVAALAGAVLDAAGFGGAEASARTIERAWFVNLETFFEKAVRRVVRDVLNGVASVSGPKRRPSLFNPDNGRYHANPDIVITRNGETIAIGDVKYKDFSNWPSVEDVHKIIAHASAYGAGTAVLFYPDEANIGIRSFGYAVTGCRLLAVGLSFETMVADVRNGLRAAEIAPTPLPRSI